MGNKGPDFNNVPRIDFLRGVIQTALSSDKKELAKCFIEKVKVAADHDPEETGVVMEEFGFFRCEGCALFSCRCSVH